MCKVSYFDIYFCKPCEAATRGGGGGGGALPSNRLMGRIFTAGLTMMGLHFQ